MIKYHKLSDKPGTMGVIQDVFAELEAVLEAKWIVKEHNFRKFINGLDKAAV